MKLVVASKAELAYTIMLTSLLQFQTQGWGNSFLGSDSLSSPYSLKSGIKLKADEAKAFF
jgi:hypothetical protein